MAKNNQEDIYVMADEPATGTVPPRPFPWWLSLLALFSVMVGAIAYFLLARQPQPNSGINRSPLPTGTSSSESGNGTSSKSPTSTPASVPTGTSSSESGNGTSSKSPTSTPASVPKGTGLPPPNCATPTAAASTEPASIRQTVYFGFNEVEVLAEDVSEIESFLSQLKGKTGTLIIAGYADNIGTEEYNQKLSEKRAERVAQKLRSLGLDNQYQVRIRGWGETQPAANNETEQCRAFNRRAVVSFSSEN